MGDSITRLREHSLTMVIWIAFIQRTISLSLLSGLVLMPVIFPVLAYASWHSYRHLGR